MANEEHLARLKQGVQEWNQWRAANPTLQPELKGADLEGANLAWADLSQANFTEANLFQANLFQANLIHANLAAASLSRANVSGACLAEANLSEVYVFQANLSWANLLKVNLTKANLREADLTQASLTGANLFQANFFHANLTEANFSGACLTEANLRGALLMETNFEGANLTGCSVYGISAWNIRLTGAQQADLVITRPYEPVITVDNLDMAQFIYLLLHNEKIREVIDTITSKAVLILGRFTPARKIVLDAMREELRRRNYLPILFDFEKPASRDLTETISTLAHMARFIIADLTEAKSIPQALQRIVPDLPSVPVQPVLQGSAEEYGMFEHFKHYPWVLETYRYESLDEVIAALTEKVIAPAELKAKELVGPMRR
jgi:uncharacterized protein YjbI with pentapeptide repeats